MNVASWALALPFLYGSAFDTSWSMALSPGAEVTIPPGSYVGPWHFRGPLKLHATGVTLTAVATPAIDIFGQIQIDGLRVVAPDGGVGIRVEPDAGARLNRLQLVGPAFAHVFVAEGSLSLTNSLVTGGEYGVLTQQAKPVEIQAVRLSGQSRDGLALVSSAGEISNCDLNGPFSEAAISLIHSTCKVRGNRLGQVGVIGLKVVNGAVQASDNLISGARLDKGLEGNDVYAFGSALTLTRDVLSDGEGPELSLIQSQAQLRKVRLLGAREAAIYVGSGSVVTASGSVITNAKVGLLLEPDTDAPSEGLFFQHVPNPTVSLPP